MVLLITVFWVAFGQLFLCFLFFIAGILYGKQKEKYVQQETIRVLKERINKLKDNERKFREMWDNRL